jgi:hypothetical protein
LASFGYVPGFGSPAAKDHLAFRDVDVVIGVVGQTQLLYESAADHVVALLKILAEPIQPIAAFTCLRASMEVASLGCWVLQPGIDHVQRLSRSFALRRKGLDEQKKLIRDHPKTDDGKLDTRYAYLDRKGIKYGLERLTLPSATALVGTTFGEPGFYRIGSAVAHGHTWALTQVGFAVTSKDSELGTVYLEKSLSPNLMAYLLILAVESLGRLAWAWTIYGGHDVARLQDLLERTYEDLKMSGGERRFWLNQVRSEQ